jgi:hypothetical protein
MIEEILETVRKLDRTIPMAIRDIDVALLPLLEPLPEDARISSLRNRMITATGIAPNAIELYRRYGVPTDTRILTTEAFEPQTKKESTDEKESGINDKKKK